MSDVRDVVAGHDERGERGNLFQQWRQLDEPVEGKYEGGESAEVHQAARERRQVVGVEQESRQTEREQGGEDERA